MKNYQKISFILFFGITTCSLHAQTMKDIDGNIYQTITYGTQTWMKENLKSTHYQNGDIIATTSPVSLAICTDSMPKYQWAYQSNDSLVNIYGRVYTWYAITDNRKVCPEGWHIPSSAEWLTLRKYLGLEVKSNKTGNELDTALYNQQSRIVTESGFSNIVGGQRSCGGAFIPSARAWWCSNDDTYRSLLWSLGPFIGHPLKGYFEEKNGHATRCIHD